MNVFERYHQKRPHLGYHHVMTVHAALPEDGPEDVILFLTNGRGMDILAITADGKMHFAPGYEPTQQAEAFRTAMNMASQQAVFPLGGTWRDREPML